MAVAERGGYEVRRGSMGGEGSARPVLEVAYTGMSSVLGEPLSCWLVAPFLSPSDARRQQVVRFNNSLACAGASPTTRAIYL